MSNEIAEAASACLSLAYEYTSLAGCVQDQRPYLIEADDQLRLAFAARRNADAAIEARIKELAAEQDDSDDPT